MKNYRLIIFITLFLLVSGATFAQHQYHHNPNPGLWPDSLETITIVGTVIIDSSNIHPDYYLDINENATIDYRLAFGPWYYQPESSAVRPLAGETITIVAALNSNIEPAPWAGNWYRSGYPDQK